MVNARKHVTPAGTDQSVTRATIFESFGQSINDVIPVANATERAQVIANLTAAGQGPSSTHPVVVIRADARGMHRLEYTYDGSVFLHASSVLSFPDRATADSWASANGGYLVTGDRAVVGGADARWNGSGWIIDDEAANPTLAAGWQTPSMNTVTRRSGFAIVTFNAIRTANSAVDAACCTIPVGYRGSRNVFGHGWGLSGGPSSTQIWYDSTTHQVRMRQTLATGESIALTMMWPITG